MQPTHQSTTFVITHTQGITTRMTLATQSALLYKLFRHIMVFGGGPKLENFLRAVTQYTRGPNDTVEYIALYSNAPSPQVMNELQN